MISIVFNNLTIFIIYITFIIYYYYHLLISALSCYHYTHQNY
jgi:hypothetical protein